MLEGLWKESIQALGVLLLSARIKRVRRQTALTRPQENNTETRGCVTPTLLPMLLNMKASGEV